MDKPSDHFSERFLGHGLQNASATLIKRGTAMGPLAPLLLLVPFFLTAAWVFKDTAVILIVFVLAAIAIPIGYFSQFAKFAKNDPDRLQSEHYRYEMKKIQIIAGKGLPFPVSADTLQLSPAVPNPNLPLPTLPNGFEESLAGGEQ